MLLRILTVAILLFPVACPAETLRELLANNHLQAIGFSGPELAQTVQGEAAIHDGQTILAYNEIKREMITAPLHLVRFGPMGTAILRRDATMKPEENCDGALLGISFLRDFTVLGTHVNPSASCILFFDRELRLVRRIYGIDWREVAPGELAIVENMIHFAPAHPERLQIDSLLHPGSAEVYPLKDDPLRMNFVSEHARHIPPQNICASVNDPCSPDVFDEDLLALTTDGQGRFGFIAMLNALHAMGPDQQPDSVLSAAVLYIYKKDDSGWLYCEKSLPDAEIARIWGQKTVDLDPRAAACTPSTRVVANGSTAGFNPFPAN